ncbi:MAG: radical SAM protein [Pirellulaceae bacterium]
MQLEEFFERIGYVTLKLTNGCNLACTYCNVEALTPQTPKMSLETYKVAAKLLLENSHQPHVGLEFHGGEPLLLPDEWFEEAVAFGKSLAKANGKTVENPLVTNGTILTKDRLLKLHDLGIRFCLSVDGPPEINDTMRGSGKAVERAIELFQENNIGFGVLTVLSRGNYSRMTEVMNWFHKVGIEDFRVNFLQPQGRGMDESQLLTGEEMFEGCRQILNHMYSTNVCVTEKETVLNAQRFMMGRQPNPPLSCWEFQCQAGRTYVAIDLTGKIHACGTDLVNHPIGHLSRDLDYEAYERKLAQLHDKGDWVIRCFDCDAKRICRHSCSTSDHNSDTYKEYECQYTKLMYNYMLNHPYVADHVTRIMQSRQSQVPRNFVPVSQLVPAVDNQVSG